MKLSAILLATALAISGSCAFAAGGAGGGGAGAAGAGSAGAGAAVRRAPAWVPVSERRARVLHAYDVLRLDGDDRQLL